MRVGSPSHERKSAVVGATGGAAVVAPFGQKNDHDPTGPAVAGKPEAERAILGQRAREEVRSGMSVDG